MSNLESFSPTPGPAIACSLNQEELEPREQDVAALFAQASQIRELADGYALAFPAGADSARALLDFVITERACCSFFNFELTFAAPHEAIWLSLCGPEGVKAMLAETFPSLRSPRDASGAAGATPAGDEA